jgi:hypothetical protein
LISLLLLYRGGLTQPLDDDTKEESTEAAAADQWEAEDRQDNEDAVQSEDEGRASLTYQTGGKDNF